VAIVCSDYKSGNKSAFEALKERLETGIEYPELAFLSVLPDCPHVGKSMKAAFENWWLKCKSESINLALIQTLRNRSNKEQKMSLESSSQETIMSRTKIGKIYPPFSP